MTELRHSVSSRGEKAGGLGKAFQKREEFVQRHSGRKKHSILMEQEAAQLSVGRHFPCA